MKYLKFTLLFFIGVLFFSGLMVLIDFNTVNAEASTLPFFDDFESYSVDSNPSTWDTMYSGISGYISNEEASSGSKSFRLDSQPNWARTEYITIDTPDFLSYETDVYLSESDKTAKVGFSIQEGAYNPKFDSIGFSKNNEIYFSGLENTILRSYSIQTWYHIKVDLDFISGTADVYIDDVLEGENLEIYPVEFNHPQWGEVVLNKFSLCSSNYPSGSHNVVYFDDVQLYNRNEEADDLSISVIQPIQVVWGASSYVKNKKTSVYLEIENSFSNQVNANIKLTYDDGITYKDEGPDGNGVPLYPGKNKIFIPGGPCYSVESDITTSPWKNGDTNPSIRLFKTGLNDVSAEIVALEISENNIEEFPAFVEETDNIKIGYWRIYDQLGIDFESPTEESYKDNISKSNYLIKSTYPISETGLESFDKGSFPGINLLRILGLGMDLAEIEGRRILSGCDVGVGIVTDSYFFDFHGAGEYTEIESIKYSKGIHLGGTKANLASVGYWTAAAHEIGHSYGLRIDEEEYITYESEGGAKAEGFWVNEKIQIIDGICFMGAASYKNSYKFDMDSYYLICNEDYENLLEVLGPNNKKISNDNKQSNTLFIRGTALKNGTAEIESVFALNDIKPEIPNEGNYSIEMFDQNNNFLLNYSFDIPFLLYASNDGRININISPFVLSLSCPENLGKITLNYRNQKLDEIIVSEGKPNIQIISPSESKCILKQENTLIRWLSDDYDSNELTYILMYSNNSIDWTPLETQLKTNYYYWDTTNFDNSDSIYIRVIVSDGLNTAEDIIHISCFREISHASVPLINPIGMTILVALLSIIAFVEIKRRK